MKCSILDVFLISFQLDCYCMLLSIMGCVSNNHVRRASLSHSDHNFYIVSVSSSSLIMGGDLHDRTAEPNMFPELASTGLQRWGRQKVTGDYCSWIELREFSLSMHKPRTNTSTNTSPTIPKKQSHYKMRLTMTWDFCWLPAHWNWGPLLEPCRVEWRMPPRICYFGGIGIYIRMTVSQHTSNTASQQRAWNHVKPCFLVSWDSLSTCHHLSFCFLLTHWRPWHGVLLQRCHALARRLSKSQVSEPIATALQEEADRKSSLAKSPRSHLWHRAIKSHKELTDTVGTVGLFDTFDSWIHYDSIFGGPAAV